MARTAFVTGGTGFLGRHVVEQLTSLGWRVVALHRPTSEVKHLKAYGVELAVGSITDAKSLLRAMPEGCDAVFHIAGNTSLWSGGDAEQTRENVGGTRNVVEAAIARKARRLVHTSTEGAWGEQHEEGFDETAKSNALASSINYERSKYLGELEVDKGVGRGLEACIMCPGHIVGKYDVSQWARMITLVHRGKLPGVPPGKGTWAHATQVAKAHIAAVDKGRSGERYLLGGTWGTYTRGGDDHRPAHRQEGADEAHARVDHPRPRARLAVGLVRHEARAHRDPGDRDGHEPPPAPLQERQGHPRARLRGRPHRGRCSARSYEWLRGEGLL